MLDPHRLFLLLGTVLFLIGLISGMAIQRCKNPRMGLSAHLAAVQNGMVLWAFGLIAPHVNLSASSSLAWVVSASYGLFVIWLAIQLAAAWGASRSLPIAGAGFEATHARERVVSFLLISASLSLVAGTSILLWGLV